MAEAIKELLRYSILCELKKEGFVYNKEKDELMTKDEINLYDAANTYAYKLDTGDLNTNRDTFIAGAKWQSEHLSSDYAWKVYNFINLYKSGAFGFVPLQEALDKNWEGYE